MTDRIDELLRGHLDRTAAGVDADRMLARVRAATPAVSRRRWLRWAGVAAGAAVAAGVGGLLLVVPEPTPVLAAPEALVAEARDAHARPTDRCYRLTVEGEAPAKAFRVWTRGDAFWLEPTADGPNWALGQEPGGRVWFALSRRRALVYEPAEVADALLPVLDFVSLRFAATLGEVLERFTLARTDAGRPGEPVRIEAAIRPTFLNRNPRFRRVTLELDPDTKAVRRAAFDCTAGGTVRFELTDAAPQPDEAYRLAGHVDADAEVLDREAARADRRRRARDEFLKRWRK